MTIERKNIFDEIIGKGVSSYESAILTCFSFDPLYFIHFYLPKLNAINITNIVVLIDSSQYDLACEEYIKYKESTGNSIQLNFSPVRIRPSFHGVFHPKIALFIGQKQCTALIGSGNLTYGGMTYNNEVWNAFSAANADADEAPIISSVWRYCSSLLENCPNTIGEQLSWMRTYSESLKSIDSLEDNVMENYRFLVNSPSKGIGQQLLEYIGDQMVKDITTVSPYYDKDGRALQFLMNNLNPESILCLGDEEAGIWPYELPEDIQGHIKFRTISGQGFEARTHAKLLQVHTETSTFFLSGSANITAAGLGLGNAKNDEATILIIQKGNRDYISDLGIIAGEEFKPRIIDGAKTTSSQKFDKEVTILSCELWNNEYVLKISDELFDVDLLRKGNYGEEFPLMHFSRLHKVEKVGYDVLAGTASLTIVRDGVVISNRILVLDDNVIRNYCPDKAMKQLNNLLSNSKNRDWDSNITEILSYVTFEENTHTVTSKTHHSSSIKKHNQSQDIIINRNDFAINPLESDSSRRNSRILDYFFNFITSDGDAVGDVEEVQSGKDIDKGTAIGDEDPDAKKTKSKTPIKTKSKEVFDFLGKLTKYYDKLCDKLDRAKQPSFLDAKTDVYRTATIKSYSSCLIAVVLLIHLTKENERCTDRIDESQLFDRFLRILGRFLLIFRDLSTRGEDDYLSIRIEGMKQNLFVYSMILLSHFDWGYKYFELSRILGLNLLSIYDSDQVRLDSAMTMLETAFSKNMVSINSRSIKEIRRLLVIFKTSKRVQFDIKSVSFPTIIFKKKLGYLLCSRVSRSKTPNKNALEYEIRVQSPGFKDFKQMELHNTQSITILESTNC